MKSRWEKYREQALTMRRNGQSIRDIEIALNIPRSTLSGWVKNIKLTSAQNKLLASKRQEGLGRARVAAAEAHKKNKKRRVESVRTDIGALLETIPVDDNRFTELALAMLYLGEGSKTKQGLRLGNSDPRVIRFYIQALKKIYKLPTSSLYFALHLRADQNVNEAKAFWSKTLGVPLASFRYHIQDSRTIGKPTRADYQGVCLAQGGSVEIQRRLMYLSEAFCERTARG